MKTFKPKVIQDFRGQDYVQTRNVCRNTTYIRNYEVTYQLSLTLAWGYNTSLVEKSINIKIYGNGTSPDAEVDVRNGRNDIVNKELTA